MICTVHIRICPRGVPFEAKWRRHLSTPLSGPVEDEPIYVQGRMCGWVRSAQMDEERVWTIQGEVSAVYLDHAISRSLSGTRWLLWLPTQIHRDDINGALRPR